MRFVVLGFAVLLFVGCSTAMTVPVTQLEDIVHDAPHDHVMYRGSDSTYHYLDRMVEGKKKKYRVRKDEYDLPGEEFRLGMEEPYRLWSEALPNY